MDIMTAQEAVERTMDAKERLCEALLEDILEDISEAAEEGKFHVAYQLAEEYMVGQEPHADVWSKAIHPLQQHGYLIVWNKPDSFLLSWPPGVECSPIEVQADWSDWKEEGGATNIPDAGQTYRDWENRTLGEFEVDLAQALIRRPWNLYFVVPSHLAEPLLALAKGQGWNGEVRRKSRCGRRTHLVFRVDQMQMSARQAYDLCDYGAAREACSGHDDQLEVGCE